MAAVEPQNRDSDWTLNTLYIHFTALLRSAEQKNEQRFSDQQKAVDAALAAAEKAVKAALEAAQKAVDKAEMQEREWRKGSNEWRQAMDDRETKFLPRSEYKSTHDGFAERLTSVENRQLRSEGTGAGLKAGWGYLVGGVGFLIAIITLFALLRK